MSPTTKNILVAVIVLLIVAAAAALFMARQSAANRQNGPVSAVTLPTPSTAAL